MPTLGAIADAPGAAGALLVVDAVTDDDLRTVSRATAHLGLVTGAAGLVLGLTGPRPGDARATPASEPGARAVVHPRSRHATAVSCLPPWSRRSAVPPLTPYFVMRVGQTPLLPYAAPGDAGQARERERQDHGPVVSGGSVRAAVDAAVGLEEVCAPVLALGDRPARLPTEEEAGEPAGRYGSCWGGVSTPRRAARTPGNGVRGGQGRPRSSPGRHGRSRRGGGRLRGTRGLPG
ncbi:class II aldolase/adducin family protein [Streptomyces diastaticus]|uniref:class II aldolase/adducin family protein n=1 Tax=Streptomyces diastaticus TaxID=1956 RepID=UPI003695AC4B